MKRLTRCLEQSKHSVPSFLPQTLFGFSSSLCEVYPLPQPIPTPGKICPTLESWWPLIRPVPSVCVHSSLVTLVMYGLGRVGVSWLPAPFPSRREGLGSLISFIFIRKRQRGGEERERRGRAGAGGGAPGEQRRVLGASGPSCLLIAQVWPTVACHRWRG